MSGKFALIIGNTEYTDPGLAQLTAPGKDTEDFARVLNDQDIGAFDHVNILLNQPEPVIREAIDEFFDQKKPDDLLLLYFSGHGVRDEFGALYLAVRNTNRARLRSTAVKSDYIRESMDQSRSRRQVLILDCCNSGAYSQGTKAGTGVSIGTASAFEGGYGRIILTASDSTQFAWEGEKVIGETDNSLFTHFLVEGLGGEADLDGDGRITVDELYDYAYERVRLATPKQTPSKFSSKQQGEIVLRQMTRIEQIKPVSLPDELIEATEDSRTFVREGAIQELQKLLKSKNLGLARSARESLERMEREDDSIRVRQAATLVLESIRPVEQKAEEARRAKEEAERKAKEERIAEEKRLAVAKAEAERKVKEKERLLAEQKAEAERKAREEAEKLAHAQAEREAERLATEREEAQLREKREAVERSERLAKGRIGEDYGAKTNVEARPLKPHNEEKIQTKRKINENQRLASQKIEEELKVTGLNHTLNREIAKARTQPKTIDTKNQFIFYKSVAWWLITFTLFFLILGGNFLVNRAVEYIFSKFGIQLPEIKMLWLAFALSGIAWTTIYIIHGVQNSDDLLECFFPIFVPYADGIFGDNFIYGLFTAIPINTFIFLVAAFGISEVAKYFGFVAYDGMFYSIFGILSFIGIRWYISEEVIFLI